MSPTEGLILKQWKYALVLCLIVTPACDSTVPQDALGLLGTLKQEAQRVAALYKAGDRPAARKECGSLKEDWKKLRGLKDSAILSFKSPGFDIPNEEDIKTLADKIESDVGVFCAAVDNGKAPDGNGLKIELTEAEDLAQRFAPLCGNADTSQIVGNTPAHSGSVREPASRH